MHELVESLRKQLSNRYLNELADAAELNIGRARLAFSTDSYVVRPLFFPGGDIGHLFEQPLSVHLALQKLAFFF